MGTNYYLIGEAEDDQHIGKQSLGHRFKWATLPILAQEKANSDTTCQWCKSKVEKPIRDEYGEQYTWDEFIREIRRGDDDDLSLVGVMFS